MPDAKLEPLPAAKLQWMAECLVDAKALGRKEALAKRGICSKTLRRYEIRSERDDTLSAKVAELEGRRMASWASEVPKALRRCVDFIERAATEGDPKDPKLVSAIAEAMIALAEAQTTQTYLDARLAAQARSAAETARPGRSHAGGRFGAGDPEMGEDEAGEAEAVH